MRRRLPRSVPGRAIIGVIALYALLLQAFLGVAAPARAVAQPGGILCAEHASDAPADGQAHTHDHPCCTAVQAAAVALPSTGAAGVAWPFAPGARLAWRPEAACPRTGPPVFASSARGPPAA